MMTASAFGSSLIASPSGRLRAVAFDAFVLSSRWEGLPRVVPQAMAAGLPLIATATDGTPEAVRDGDTGWLVAPADPAALADRMERFLADPARARAMGARGRECVAEFSAERMVERLEQLYQDLVGIGG